MYGTLRILEKYPLLRKTFTRNKGAQNRNDFPYKNESFLCIEVRGSKEKLENPFWGNRSCVEKS